MKRRHTKYWTLTRWQAEMGRHEKSLRIYRARRDVLGAGDFPQPCHVPGRLLATSKLRNKR